MQLTDDEREFIEIYRKAKQDNDMDILISIYTFLDTLLERRGFPLSGLLAGFTRGQYKRAIKLLRVAQAQASHAGKPNMATEYDCSVRYIRERCLQRMAVVA